MSVEIQETALGRCEHIVQFYEHDSELVASVVPYLAAGVRAGETTIVVAGDAHLRAFAQGLAAAGIEVPPVGGAGGDLVALDAASTLASLTVDGQLDGDAFAAIVGGRVRRAAASGRPLRVYGEMVALLWQAGDVLGAIKLEELWNELARQLPFALFCSYPAAVVEGSEHVHALHEVCRLHSSVLPAGTVGTAGTAGGGDAGRSSRELRGEFSAGQEAPGRARRFAVAALREWGLDDALLDEAALVLSELASNAVLHAGSPFSIAISSRESRLRIAVTDTCPCRPAGVVSGSLLARAGHGLGVVEALSHDWGVQELRDGKVVWAELSC
jgi:anti-sigma regulatory factor (Ser/Thr protein kinase)